MDKAILGIYINTFDYSKFFLVLSMTMAIYQTSMLNGLEIGSGGYPLASP